MAFVEQSARQTKLNSRHASTSDRKSSKTLTADGHRNTATRIVTQTQSSTTPSPPGIPLQLYNSWNNDRSVPSLKTSADNPPFVACELIGDISSHVSIWCRRNSLPSTWIKSLLACWASFLSNISYLQSVAKGSLIFNEKYSTSLVTSDASVGYSRWKTIASKAMFSICPPVPCNKPYTKAKREGPFGSLDRHHYDLD